MSSRKPPPRPPLPRAPTAKSGQTTVVAPVRSLRNAFSSISILYSSNSKESDSEEEISIVRKADSGVLEEDHGEVEKEQNKDEQKDCVTQNKLYVQPSRPEDSSAEGVSSSKSKSPGPCLKFSNKSTSSEELGKTLEKRSIPKQNTWPIYSRLEETSDASIMKFLRGRDRDQGQETKCDVAKDAVLLSEKLECDSDLLTSKSHAETGLDGKLKTSEQRSRSPSPFRRLNRQPKGVESTSEKSTNSSGISLSSLLASIGKEEAHVVGEESASDTEESSSNPDVSERPSSADLSFVNSCQFEAARPKPLSRPAVDKSPDFSGFCFFTLVVYIYLITWTPAYISGMVTGMLVMYLGCCAFLWLFCPEDTAAERYERELIEYEEMLAKSPKPVYRSVDPGLLQRRDKLEGWMYKSYDYHPDKFDFNSETLPVFASLSGTNLILSHPKVDGSGKRFDPRSVEDGTDILFSRHEHYDLTGSKVSLLPLTMTMKRIWSRKCPIFIFLEKPMAVAENISYCTSDKEDDDTVIVHNIKHQDSFEDTHALYLFPKIGREKEEWFNHLVRILSPDGSPQYDALGTSCSYPHYMAKLLPQPDTKLQSQQRQIAWVNVLFGRTFWDVLQDKYWTNKIKQRFENKLAKLKKPSFIRDIAISDLNLGDSLPVINKALPPVLDEHGTWVDLEVTYNGGLIFTFEGHLNIEGYLTSFLKLGKNENADLEMAELSKKFEMKDREHIMAEGHNVSDSESPPESDSDFESPESDIEELTFKALQGSLPQHSDKDNDGQQNETSNSVTPGSFESDKEVMENKDSLFGSQTSCSEDADKTSLKSRKQIYSQRQSSGEETPASSKTPPESSTSSPVKRGLDLSTTSRPRRKIFSVIERLAKSKWVKKAAETGIVKRAAERFSNLPIILTVEVQTVKGTLALNIPPPPTNRLWYGFRGMPLLFVSARPKLGDRQVKLTHVTDWIEKKLKQEFKNMFVLPNMEDVPIRVMNSGLEETFPEW